MDICHNLIHLLVGMMIHLWFRCHILMVILNQCILQMWHMQCIQMLHVVHSYAAHVMHSYAAHVMHPYAAFAMHPDCTYISWFSTAFCISKQRGRSHPKTDHDGISCCTTRTTSTSAVGCSTASTHSQETKKSCCCRCRSSHCTEKRRTDN